MSMASFIQLFEWLSEHPVIAGLLVFAIALSESLALIGLIIPGVLFMVLFGALITTGYLDFSTTVIAAILGAIAGDGISYWLGRRYHKQLNNLWPFRNRPQLMERGNRFFHRHGGKSILLGRFVGPLRPIIPAIAGMLDMPIGRFAFTNVLSALLWGPIVLLPGMAFGLSLEVASEFAGRFSLLLVILLALLWLVFWIIKQVYSFLVPRTDILLSHVINWINRHPLVGQVPAALIDSKHPEMRALTLLAFVLLFAAIAFTALSQFLSERSLVLGMNDLVHFQLQQLQTPLFERIALVLNHLGDDIFLGVLTGIMLTWFVLHRNWLATGHLLAAFILPLIVIHTLQLLFYVPPPDILATQSAFNFPGAHIALATAVYGFIAVALSRELPYPLHAGVYMWVSLILLIGFSRLYLGIHWLSDVLGGILLGLIWVALLGIGYRRHIHLPTLPLRTLFYPSIAALVLFIVYPLSQPGKLQPASATTTQSYRVGWQAWQESGWEQIQQYRSDLMQRKKYPINLQWLATQKQITSVMKKSKWLPNEHSIGDLTGWLRPSTTLQQLPIIPHLHEGRYETIRYVRYDVQHNRVLVARFWKTDIYVEKQQSERPLWSGEISYLEPIEFGPIQYLKTTDNFNQALRAFTQYTSQVTVVAQHNAGSNEILLVQTESEMDDNASK